MSYPLSRFAASPRKGAYGQPATASLRGGAAGVGPCWLSLAE